MTDDFPDAAWRASLRRRLLRWYRKNARDLPWRGTDDPYRVWISEIMLQQTQVATVIPYYERFIERFPNVVVLASAEEEEVLRHWEGLGYYRRARQLHAAAKQVVAEHRGRFPTTFDAVFALPGIGRYTAGAILSISLGRRLPIVEANTIRLYCRLLAHRPDPTTASSQKRLWAFAEALLPRSGTGELNQALMELGAEICKPQSPRCDDCPVRAQCPTFINQWQAEIPAPKRKTRFESIREAAVVVRRGERVLVRLCGAEERWAGLWDFPRFEVPLRGELTAGILRDGVQGLANVEVEPGNRLLQIKHGVTRFRITLECYEALCVDTECAPSSTLRWVTLDELQETPLNTTARRLANHLVSETERS